MHGEYTRNWYTKLQWLRVLAAFRMLILFGFYLAASSASLHAIPVFLAPYGFYLISAFAAGMQLANRWPRPSWYKDKPKQSDVKHNGLITSIGFVSLAAALTSLCATSIIAIATLRAYNDLAGSPTTFDVRWMIALTVTGTVVTLLDALCYFTYARSRQEF